MDAIGALTGPLRLCYQREVVADPSVRGTISAVMSFKGEKSYRLWLPLLACVGAALFDPVQPLVHALARGRRNLYHLDARIHQVVRIQ